MRMEFTETTFPKVLIFIAWLWILGAVWKLFNTYWSWPDFELWRNIFLVVMKLLMLLSGIMLLRGLKIGPVIYFIVTAINTSIFYANPPNIDGIEIYFTQYAIGLAILVPTIYLLFIGYNWKHLK